MIETAAYFKSCNVNFSDLPLGINQEEIMFGVTPNNTGNPALNLNIEFQGMERSFDVPLFDCLPWDAVPDIEIPIHLFRDEDPLEALGYALSKVLVSIGEAKLWIRYDPKSKKFIFKLSIGKFVTGGELALSSVMPAQAA